MLRWLRVARTQSRRSVSISMELHDGLLRLRERHRVPVAQIISQLVWALIRGQIAIEPARSPYQLGLETRALRAAVADVESHVDRETWEVMASRATCAICGERGLVALTPLEAGGAQYPICWACGGATRPPAEPRPGRDPLISRTIKLRRNLAERIDQARGDEPYAAWMRGAAEDRLRATRRKRVRA